MAQLKGTLFEFAKAYYGDDVQFRFRLGSDNSNSHEGWYVDDISVSSCSGGNDVIFVDGFDGP